MSPGKFHINDMNKDKTRKKTGKDVKKMPGRKQKHRYRESSSEQSKRAKLPDKILTIAGAIICAILIPLLIANCILLAKSHMNENQIPNLAGMTPLMILTDSMFPEIEAGDMVICQTTNPDKIKKGDVIAYYDPAGSGKSVVTHRVEEVVKTKKDGISWITKGDANNVSDSEPVPEANLVGIYQYRLKGLGNVAMFMQTTKGLLICVVAPLLIWIVYDGIRRQLEERKKKSPAMIETIGWEN